MSELKLKFGEVEVNLSLGLLFLGNVIERFEIKPNEIPGLIRSNPFLNVPLMIFEAAKAYSFLKKETFELTENDIFRFLESDGGVNSNQLKRFSDSYIESLVKNVPKEISKKKITKKPK
jgi:uncharacterized protein YneR